MPQINHTTAGQTQEAAREITELFKQKVEVSLMRDIAPILLKHHRYQVLDERLCLVASEEVAQALTMAQYFGIYFDCIPEFSPEAYNNMAFSDMIYKRSSQPVSGLPKMELTYAGSIRLSEAAAAIQEICKSRKEDDACASCPFYSMCGTEPYTWEIRKIPREGLQKP